MVRCWGWQPRRRQVAPEEHRHWLRWRCGRALNRALRPYHHFLDYHVIWREQLRMAKMDVFLVQSQTRSGGGSSFLHML
jgi:hypothetical protein